MAEWRWRLQPLTARDASNDVGNLVEALNLNRRDRVVPALPLPPAPEIAPCIPDVPLPGKWRVLLELFEGLFESGE